MRRKAELIRRELDGGRPVGPEPQQTDELQERHTIVWVASEPSPKQDSPPPTAKEVIRERERRTRERWRAEDRQRPAEVHHHYHQTVIRDTTDAHRAATASDDGILDAEVVEETFTEAGSTARPVVGEPLALPPASPNVIFPNPTTEEVRRRGRQ